MIAGDRLEEPAAQKRLQEAMKTQKAAKAG
jgi:hypothetical protein